MTGHTNFRGARSAINFANMANFTKLEGQYLAFISSYRRLHARAPAEAELQRHFGVTPPTVHQMIRPLERKGLITRVPKVARSIEVCLTDPAATARFATGCQKREPSYAGRRTRGRTPRAGVEGTRQLITMLEQLFVAFPEALELFGLSVHDTEDQEWDWPGE